MRRKAISWLTLAALALCLMLTSDGGPLQAAAQLDPYTGQPTGQGARSPASNSAGQAYATETPEQLQQVVAPIALYPDTLVASILAASGYPAEITEANNWLASRRNMRAEDLANEADKQPWDASVKSLLPFPPVLQNMASNLSWTSELGDAYTNQQADVMDAIQEMRKRAKKAGTLKSNDQIKVTEKSGYISIDARDPREEVYVPAYDPWDVYGSYVAPWPGWVETPGLWWDGPGLNFGLGFGMGPWWGYGWGWPGWGINWYSHGLFFGGRPYFGYGPAFFNRYNYYRGYPGFARPYGYGRGTYRGYDMPRYGSAPHYAPGTRSGPFGGYHYGGNARNYSSRGQGSVGGGFHGGGFGGGGFHGGGGGGFHGGGGGRR
jgi:Protein of unknown function (DUF3300)